MKVCILDYGSGNVKSVFNLLSSLTNDVKISNDNADIQDASHLILPGVGAFGASMQKIRSSIDLPVLADEVFNKKKPFLGICVGMQVLAEKGYEFGEHEGLGWIPGSVVQLNTEGLPLPHIGWNNIILKNASCPLLKEINNDFDFYYVHSYVFSANGGDDATVATTNYGQEFSCIINKENIYGVQFHPEKSQIAGKKIISNFLKYC